MAPDGFGTLKAETARQRTAAAASGDSQTLAQTLLGKSFEQKREWIETLVETVRRDMAAKDLPSDRVKVSGHIESSRGNVMLGVKYGGSPTDPQSESMNSTAYSETFMGQLTIREFKALLAAQIRKSQQPAFINGISPGYVLDQDLAAARTYGSKAYISALEKMTGQPKAESYRGGLSVRQRQVLVRNAYPEPGTADWRTSGVPDTDAALAERNKAYLLPAEQPARNRAPQPGRP